MLDYFTVKHHWQTSTIFMNNSKVFLAALSAIALTSFILWGTTHPAFSQDQTPAASGQGNMTNKQECIKQLDLSRQQKMQLIQLKKSSEDKKAKFEQLIRMLSLSLIHI